jgi:DNA-binding SARP family transcriptional activator
VRTRYAALLRCAGEWTRLLELDETDEEAHRELMRQHLAAGRRREAADQFAALRRSIEDNRCRAAAGGR